MINYYAVKKGINPGIYLTWKECEENVKGYSSAKYKKFVSKEEAEEYMLNDDNNKKESKYPLGIKSQKELKEYTKNTIKRIGLCESLKKEYPKEYKYFLELFKRHPNYEEKVKGLVDIKIRKNKKYSRQKEVLIEKESGEIIDISVLNKCINGCKSNDLNKAMRNAIENQIEEYRKNNELKCEKCDSKSKPEVDHKEILFVELYENFIRERKDIPTEFENTISNSKCFKICDKNFEEEWIKYHKENAKLRILCSKCNNKKENKIRNNEEEDEDDEEDEYDEEENKEEDKERVLTDNYNFSECINIYTDGSCINNGKEDAVCGYGVYYEGEYKKSTSKKLKKKEGYKITNNRAELKAILSGLEKLEKEIEEGKEIVVHTDSIYSIQVLTNNKTYERIKKGKEVPNKDYVKKGYKLIEEYPNIKFHHILAHTGKKDNYSIGNDKADKLANEAIKEEIGKIILTFGKYKGGNLMDVYKKDSKYLVWCIENSKNQIHDIKLFMDTYLNLDTQIKN